MERFKASPEAYSAIVCAYLHARTGVRGGTVIQHLGAGRYVTEHYTAADVVRGLETKARSCSNAESINAPCDPEAHIWTLEPFLLFLRTLVVPVGGI